MFITWCEYLSAKEEMKRTAFMKKCGAWQLQRAKDRAIRRSFEFSSKDSHQNSAELSLVKFNYFEKNTKHFERFVSATSPVTFVIFNDAASVEECFFDIQWNFILKSTKYEITFYVFCFRRIALDPPEMKNDLDAVSSGYKQNTSDCLRLAVETPIS